MLTNKFYQVEVYDIYNIAAAHIKVIKGKCALLQKNKHTQHYEIIYTQKKQTKQNKYSLNATLEYAILYKYLFTGISYLRNQQK